MSIPIPPRPGSLDSGPKPDMSPKPKVVLPTRTALPPKADAPGPMMGFDPIIPAPSIEVKIVVPPVEVSEDRLNELFELYETHPDLMQAIEDKTATEDMFVQKLGCTPAEAKVAIEDFIETIFFNKYFDEAAHYVIEQGRATQKDIQSEFGITAKEAKYLMDQLEEKEVIGPAKPGKSREILVTEWSPDEDEEEDEEEDAKDSTVTDPAVPAISAVPIAPALPPRPTPATTPAVPATPAVPITPPLPPRPATPAIPAVPATSAVPVIPAVEGARSGDDDEDEETTLPPSSTPPWETFRAEDFEDEEEVEEEPAEEQSRWQFIKSTFGKAAKRFKSQFAGEVQPEEEKGAEKNPMKLAETAVSVPASIWGTIYGYQGFHDVPAWIAQKYATEKEKKGIMDALHNQESSLIPSPVEAKTEKLKEAIKASHYLTREKKAELLNKLSDTIETYERDILTHRQERDEKLKGLLDQYIQTRISNTRALKQGLNTALTFSGLMVGRMVMFGAVSAYEHHKTVKKERLAGEREGGYFREMVVNGFSETLVKLGRGVPSLGKAGVHGSKFLYEKFVGKDQEKEQASLKKLRKQIPAALAGLQAFGTVGRGIGIINLGIGEILDAFEHLSALEHTQTVGGHEIYSKHLPDVGPNQAAAESAIAGALAHSTEGAHPIEYSHEQLEMGTVQKGDGIIKILERQGVSSKEALHAVREAGLVRVGGDTRLATDSIGRLAIMAKMSPDGHVEGIVFHDTQTGIDYTPQEIHAQDSLIYEHGTVPGEIPSDTAITPPSVDAPHAEVADGVPTAPEVPAEDLPTSSIVDTSYFTAGNQQHVIDGLAFEGLHLDADKILNASGDIIFHIPPGDTAHFIESDGRVALLCELPDGTLDHIDFHDGTADHTFILPEPPIAEVELIEPDAIPSSSDADSAPESTPTHEAEPLRVFKGPDGTIKFGYDINGEVKSAFIPAYTPTLKDIESSLKEWDLSRDQVSEHFFDKHGGVHRPGVDFTSRQDYVGSWHPIGRDTSASNEIRQFTKNAEHLIRQEFLLDEMRGAGLEGTQEYTFWKKDTEALQNYVAKQVDREFPGTKRSP